MEPDKSMYRISKRAMAVLFVVVLAILIFIMYLDSWLFMSVSDCNQPADQAGPDCMLIHQVEE